VICCKWSTVPGDHVPEGTAATDYTKGVAFLFDTAARGMKLDPGVHNYYFEFWDNWAYWINWDQYFMSAALPTDLKVEGR